MNIKNTSEGLQVDLLHLVAEHAAQRRAVQVGRKGRANHHSDHEGTLRGNRGWAAEPLRTDHPGCRLAELGLGGGDRISSSI